MNEFTVKWWVAWFFGCAGTGIVSGFGILCKKYKAMRCRQTSFEHGLQALLRAEIVKLYNEYIDMDELPFYERENIHALYDQYSKLGGNGTITDLVDALLNLPTPPQEAHK